MSKKMTISEFRTFISKQVKVLVENQLKKNLLEGVEDIEQSMSMLVDFSGHLTTLELHDIAMEHGLELDDSELHQAYSNIYNKIQKIRLEELKYDINYVIESIIDGETLSFSEFYEVFQQQNFENSYDKSEVMDVYSSITTNQNQLALFENSENNNIRENKYGIITINKPIIPDAVTVLSKNNQVIVVNSKSEFKQISDAQTYFSASYSHCFYSLDEYNAWTQKHVIEARAEGSIMLFETGHEIVQVWDDKNQIGYIIPKK